MTEQANCPMCGRPSCTTSGLRNFFCHHCKMEFDSQDDGNVTYKGPERIAERNERHEMNQAMRKSTRRTFR